MIDFKDININDAKLIDAILKRTNFRASDLSFANLFSWIGRFNSHIALLENNFFLRSRCSENVSCYMFPVGEMPLKSAINLIVDDAHERNLHFKIIGATREMYDLLSEEFTARFEFLPNRDASDYLYLTEKLISLSGKKLQSKRNHINKFKAENKNWAYRKITDDKGIADCITMLQEWEKVEKERLLETQQFEYQAIMTMLENFFILELVCGAIYVDNRIVAFSLGEQLTDDTFVIHCEKAFSGIQGAYSIINQQFVQNEASNFKYVNREEDLGIENLRKAKLSYQPEFILEKGQIILAVK